MLVGSQRKLFANPVDLFVAGVWCASADRSCNIWIDSRKARPLHEMPGFLRFATRVACCRLEVAGRDLPGTGYTTKPGVAAPRRTPGG